MLLIFFLLVFPLFLFLIIHKQRNYADKSNLLPPGPHGLPLIGNLHQLDNSTLHVYLWQLSQKYGSLISLRLGLRKAIVVSSAKMAKEVLKTHDIDFCSRPALLGQQKLSYDGLDLAFSPFDSYNKEIRKISSLHLFSPNRAKLFRPIREDEVSQMIDKVSKSCDASKPINLSEVMVYLTSSIICRVGFGKRCVDKGSEISKFNRILSENEVMLSKFFVCDYFPSMRWVDRLTGGLSRLENVVKELDAFYRQLIDDHLDPKRQKPEQEDIIDVFLKIMKDPQSTSHISFDHIKAILMNVFVAGTDTSAAAVVWAMTFLMKYPATMKKAQEEVRNFAGKKRFLDEDEIQDLPYLKAVVKETFIIGMAALVEAGEVMVVEDSLAIDSARLRKSSDTTNRLQSVVPLLLPRETLRDCNIGGYKIPAKTLVYVNAWAIGRDTEAWGQNSEDFCPERFMDSSIDYKGQDFGLIPFGSGRRICPGMHMGAATVELALANLLYRFDWKMPPGMKEEDLDFDIAPGLVIHKRNHLFLMATEYRS
ncbi:hypothetical protein SLE2022_151600 [Rubroshorea leprosula]